ncbi:MAG: hypothetical protein ABL962_02575 [Fimbriimonadaceae bacterium]
MLFNSRYRNALATLRAVEPEGHVAKKRRQPLKFVVGGVSVATIATLSLLFSVPKDALAQMSQRLASVRASHTRYFVGKTVAYEVWQDGVKRRYHYVNTIDRGYDGESVWIVYPAHPNNGGKGYSLISDEEPDGFGYNGTSARQSISSLDPKYVKGLKVTTKKVPRDSTTESVTTAEGTWKDGGRRFKHVYTCREPDLPYRIDYYSVDVKGARLIGYTAIDYPKAIDPTVFEFHPPKDLPLLDHKKARAAILDGVAGNGETASAGGETITFLGALQERQGDGVYLLYTGGATPHIDCTASVVDEKGIKRNVSIYYEEDDRERPRNFGIPDKAVKSGGKPKISRLGIDRPIQLRPLSIVNGTPVYALHVRLGKMNAMLPTRLTISLPICKKGKNRVLQLDEKWAKFQSEGEQVGSGVFEVKTIPVDFVGTIMRQLDPKALNSWGSVPLRKSKP